MNVRRVREGAQSGGRGSKLLALLFTILLLALTVATVSADDAYHTEHLALTPVSGAPLRSGFVNNIHANGPEVYAREQYMLNGALPNSSYDVSVVLHGDTSCAPGSLLMALTTATLQTNGAGNGTAYAVFTPEDAASLSGYTLGIKWEISMGGALVYETECTTVTLD